MYHLLYNFWFKHNSLIPRTLGNFNNVSHFYEMTLLKFISEINDVLRERQIVILSIVTSCFYQDRHLELRVRFLHHWATKLDVLPK